VSVIVVKHKDVLKVINELLKDSHSILDIGCGIGATLKGFPCPVKVGIDAHRPYLEKAKPEASFIPIHMEAERLGEFFLDKSFDAVSLIDVIEHFKREAGLGILQQAENIARRKVIVFTPRGFFKQKAEDHYGLGGEKYQKHHSGWEMEDFLARGYKVILFSKFHDQSNTAFVQAYGRDGDPIDAILAWKDFQEETILDARVLEDLEENLEAVKD